jgi:quinoprotein dehydrogenase-associated probable ABC transporter substrate-binding protein
MCSVCKALVCLFLGWATLAFAAEPQDLWVCADRNNLPYSNDREQGFENKLAEMVAHDLGRTLHYVWWPPSPTLSHKIFRRGACDVIMGIPSKGYDLAEPTLPYYRSTYVFVSQRDRHVAIQSFDDPSLRIARIGVHVIDDGLTPAAQELATRGMIRNIVGYNIFGNLATANPAADLIRAVVQGDVDVAIAWGPLAGYFAERASVPLRVSLICAASLKTSVPVAFDISMGVRRGEEPLREQLNQEIARRLNDIHALLLSYGVPLVDTDPTSRSCK